MADTGRQQRFEALLREHRRIVFKVARVYERDAVLRASSPPNGVTRKNPARLRSAGSKGSISACRVVIPFPRQSMSASVMEGHCHEMAPSPPIAAEPPRVFLRLFGVSPVATGNAVC